MSFSFSGNNGMASGTVVHWKCHPNRLVWRWFSEFLFFHEWEWNEHVISSGSESTGNVQTVFANLGFIFVSRSRIVYEGQHGCQELSHLSHEGVCPSESASGSSGGLRNGKNARGNWAEWFMCRGT